MDKKIPPHKEAAFKVINEQFSGNNHRQQCRRMLEALLHFPLNTFEASRGLGIYHPPARALQLRKHGHQINTVWVNVEAENGITHRIGCYVLVKGANDD